MAVTTEWLEGYNNILVHRFKSGWTTQEYIDAIDSRADILQRTPSTVHIILDITMSDAPPSNLFQGMLHAVRRRQPNQGLTVVVSSNAFIRALGKIAERMDADLAKLLLYTHTVEEALQIIFKENGMQNTSG
jgi:hypothetical protein